MKQLVLLLTVELALRLPGKELRARNKKRRGRRAIVATLSGAKPGRNLKLSELQLKDELQLKERPLARKRRNPLESDHEVAKVRVHRNDRKTNEFD
jgi:hypothetical protein